MPLLKKYVRLSFFLLLLYGKPASSSECQHPETCPASTLRRVPSSKELVDGTLSSGIRPLTPYWTEPFSNVHRCWLAMPLGASILSWVLAYCTIEEGKDRLAFIYRQMLSSWTDNYPLICRPMDGNYPQPINIGLKWWRYCYQYQLIRHWDC